MRSLVAQRLPLVNIPHVRVCLVGSVHHAWQTFTLSSSLQQGVWLLRCLRPPSRTLAFSCPTEVGKARGSSPVPAQQTIATRSCLLYAGCLGDTASQRSDLVSPAPSRFGSGVSQPLSPRPRHDASDRGFSRQHRSQDSSGQPRMARRSCPFISRLRTPVIANHRRPLHSPHTVVHVWFFVRTICCPVKGRTRTPAVSRARKRERGTSGGCWRRLQCDVGPRTPRGLEKWFLISSLPVQ